MILKVLTYPDNRLRRISTPVESFGADLYSLVENMLDTLVAQDGVGLAAPQVGITQRLFIVRTDTFSVDPFSPSLYDENVSVVINPKLEMSTEYSTWPEACLSLPGATGRVKRSQQIRMTFQTPSGEIKTQDFSWPFSAVLQHENDHLDGILYINRLSRFAANKLRADLKKSQKRKKNPKPVP
jgi:peptide deformylase